jgi:hypothetical protein
MQPARGCRVCPLYCAAAACGVTDLLRVVCFLFRVAIIFGIC